MPHLSRIVFDKKKEFWLHQVIGKALLRLPRPLKVEEIERLGDARPAFLDLTSPLAVAIAEGRLPLLRSLDIYNNGEGIAYFCQPQNLAYLGKAITRGYLSQLRTLLLEGVAAVNIFEQAYRGRLAHGQHGGGTNKGPFFQANVHTLSVLLKDNRLGHSWGRLLELLSLPAFGHLQILSLLSTPEEGDEAEELVSRQLATIAAYI